MRSIRRTDIGTLLDSNHGAFGFVESAVNLLEIVRVRNHLIVG